MISADDQPEDDIKILGTATLKVSGSVLTDIWTDYESKRSCSERFTFDISSASHFGWCLGLHVVYLAEALIEGQTSNQPDALRGLAQALSDKAAEILEALEKTSDK